MRSHPSRRMPRPGRAACRDGKNGRRACAAQPVPGPLPAQTVRRGRSLSPQQSLRPTRFPPGVSPVLRGLLASVEGKGRPSGLEFGNLLFQLSERFQILFRTLLKIVKLLEQFRGLRPVGVHRGIGEQLFHFVLTGEQRFQGLFLLGIAGLKGLELLVERIALFGLFALELF